MLRDIYSVGKCAGKGFTLFVSCTNACCCSGTVRRPYKLSSLNFLFSRISFPFLWAFISRHYHHGSFSKFSLHFSRFKFCWFISKELKFLVGCWISEVLFICSLASDFKKFASLAVVVSSTFRGQSSLLGAVIVSSSWEWPYKTFGYLRKT